MVCLLFCSGIPILISSFIFFLLQLYELMIMAFKYQVFLCPRPKDLLLISYNHIDTIREFVKDTPVVLNQVDETHRKIIEVYCFLFKCSTLDRALRCIASGYSSLQFVQFVLTVWITAVSFYHLYSVRTSCVTCFRSAVVVGLLIFIRRWIPASQTNTAHIFSRHARSSEFSAFIPPCADVRSNYSNTLIDFSFLPLRCHFSWKIEYRIPTDALFCWHRAQCLMG